MATKVKQWVLKEDEKSLQEVRKSLLDGVP
jgi:hypothetical protein